VLQDALGVSRALRGKRVSHLEEEGTETTSPEEVQRADEELSRVVRSEVEGLEGDTWTGSEQGSESGVVLRVSAQLPLRSI